MISSVISDSDFARVLTLMRQLVSPRVGILRRTLLLPTTGGQIPCTHFAAAVADYGTLPTGGSIANPGASSWDPRMAIAQVAFEALERYCAAFVDYGSLVRSKPVEDAFAAGMKVQRFADEQYADPRFPFVPVTEESDIHWAVGRSLYSGERRFVPASLTYLPYVPASRAEVLGPTFSTGMAAAWDRDAACLNGVLELVERDGFMLKWMTGTPGDVLIPSPGSLLDEHVFIVERDGRTRVTFTDMTSDLGIPVVCCLLERQAFGRTLLNIGLSCKLSWEAACDKALCEALSDHERVRQAIHDGTEQEWDPGEGFANVTDFEWHGMLYAREEFQHGMEPLRGNGTHRVVEDVPDDRTVARQLHDVLEILAPHVSDVIAVDVTTREVEALGVRVMKVFAPELMPLNADHRYPYLGHGRLHAARRDSRPFTQIPHPFS
jgi:ribosomal protein S12 methylthiotransferase accessory factor